MPMNKIMFHPGDIPARPGVYVYRDAFGQVIYVGKAVNLRRRMSQYFQPSRKKRADPKFRSLVNSIASWECLSVRREEESLLLESRLIKEYAPKYNILLRDDKRLPLLKIDRMEKFPRLKLARLRKDDSCLYFGPFPNRGALKQTMEFLCRHFGLRTCRHPDPGEEQYAHCLAGTVRDCCRPCVGKTSPEDYQKRVDGLIALLNGQIAEVTVLLKTRMANAAQKRNFEKAALYRDIARNIRSLYGASLRTFPNAHLPQMVNGAAAVDDLQKALKLQTRPNHMICFDNSNISGTLAVASMVDFRGGHPNKRAYRRFRIRTVQGADDFAMMREIVTRHFTRLLDEGRNLPDLMIVDGGKGQLSSAVGALVALRCPPFPVIGLAERNEEVFIPGYSKPVIIDRDRPALKLLQAIRDESHRFAITYHRALRLRTIRNSILDEIPGVGVLRKQMLLTAFGSVTRLRRATPQQIAAKIPSIGDALAANIAVYLEKHPPTGNFDIQ